MRSLAEQRDLVKAVLDGISDGVVSLTGRNRVAIANAAAIELLGWKKVPKGKRIQKRVPPALWEHIQEIREFGPTLAEITFERKTVEVASAQLTKGKGIVVVLRDVTELRRLERVRRDFLANVSHELGTPVAVIRANTETLLDGGAIDDERGRLLFTEAIDRQAHRLSALISDLLQISRIEAGELMIEMQEVSLSESFLAVVESTSPDAEKRQVSIVAEPTDLVIRADARALHSILENLVSNAIKYGNSKVVLSARPEGPRTRISVSDDGPGIPEEHRERVFERFYRVD